MCTVRDVYMNIRRQHGYQKAELIGRVFGTEQLLLPFLNPPLMSADDLSSRCDELEAQLQLMLKDKTPCEIRLMRIGPFAAAIRSCIDANVQTLGAASMLNKLRRKTEEWCPEGITREEHVSHCVQDYCSDLQELLEHTAFVDVVIFNECFRVPRHLLLLWRVFLTAWHPRSSAAVSRLVPEIRVRIGLSVFHGHV